MGKRTLLELGEESIQAPFSERLWLLFVNVLRFYGKLSLHVMD